MAAPFPVLIVDDDPISLKILERFLVKKGYEVVIGRNGHHALKLMGNQYFPMVITDWMMPEMDGVELCKAVRKMRLPGYVFIILMTAKSSKEDIITGLEAGADDYLTKPFNQAELSARINTGRRILDLERSLRKANEEIRLLSITDPLTGTYNRAYLNDNFPVELKRSKRYGHPFALILCDLDHFKRINDTHGHQAGDKVLQESVLRIKELIRLPVDWVVRYGGEEFLIVLPETDFSGAMRLAERLRLHVAEGPILVDQTEINVTASFGVTGVAPSPTEKDHSMDTLIRQADGCLYRAKAEGRNRTVGEAL